MTIRVLSHVGGVERLGIPDDLAARVEVVRIPFQGPLADDVTGDVLVSFSNAESNLPAVLQRGVRWVHFVGTGIDGFPLDRISDGCVLTNARGVSAVPIAEWILGCMLAFEKHLPDAWINEAPEHWNTPVAPFGALHGGTLALLGLGGIGTAVATRASAFGMRIKALRRRPEPSPVPGVELVSDVLELVDGADHVVVVAPLTDATRGVVDRRLFAAMKPGVHLLNVARGPLVVSDDLRVALDDGTVAMASLDVTDPEPLPPGHWMFGHPRVRVSPHVSWSWPHAADAMNAVFVDDLRRFLDGRPLVSVVERDAGY